MNNIKPVVDITYTHGNKYTKKWIGFAKNRAGGGFSLYYLYNGGRFGSEAEVLKGIEAIRNGGIFEVGDVKKVASDEYVRD